MVVLGGGSGDHGGDGGDGGNGGNGGGDGLVVGGGDGGAAESKFLRQLLLTCPGAVIEDYIKPYGYSTVREFCGHGIGKVRDLRSLHPPSPNTLHALHAVPVRFCTPHEHKFSATCDACLAACTPCGVHAMRRLCLVFQLRPNPNIRYTHVTWLHESQYR